MDSKKTTSNTKILFFLLTIMSVFLNQSGVLFGINISLSDILLPFVMVILLFENNFRTPKNVFLYFILLTTVVIFTTLFYSPIKFSISPNPSLFFNGYLKLVVIFLYLVIGYNISKKGMLNIALKGFVWGAVLSGILGIVTTFFNISAFNDLLYLGGVRYKGFMNDPNYFAVLQNAALAYVISTEGITNKQRFCIGGVLFLSILLTGSKTGLIITALLLLRIIIKKLYVKKINLTKILFVLFVLFLVIILASFIKAGLEKLVEEGTVVAPIIERSISIFDNFSESLSDNGSGREIAWLHAVNLIKESPLLGVGVGIYQEISMKLFGVNTIAHNTYLQLMVEWGSINTLIFIGYLFFTYFKVPNNKVKPYQVKSIKNILFVFSIGSLAISLNNARLFWLLFGAFIFYSQPSKKIIPEF